MLRCPNAPRLFWLVFLAFMLAQQAAAARRTAVVVVVPKNGTSVGSSARIHGRISRPGRPVVMVKAKSGNAWWVQPPALVNKKGYFQSVVRFGNEKTPDGCLFHIVVVLVQDVRVLRQCKTGAAFKQLPTQIPKSVVVEVKFARTKAKKEKKGKNLRKAIAVVIRSPAKGLVKRVHTLDGETKQAGVPIVLVRSTVPNSPWWVQQHPKRLDKGKIKITARFGNQTTKAGSKFQLVILLLPDKNKIPKPGAIFKELPRDIPKSRQLTVSRQ